MIEIQCKECGALYAAQRKSRLYCSKLCMNRACSRRRKRPSRRLPVQSKNCLYCGNKFETTRPKQKYCNKRCLHKSWVTSHRDKINQQAVLGMKKRRELFPEKVKAINSKFREKPEERIKAAEKSRLWHAANKHYANPKRQVRQQVQRNQCPWHVSVNAASARAKLHGLPFDLTIAWAQERWTGYCELTGLPFTIGSRKNGKMFSPSLDRVVPELGYTQANCRFILYCVNIFKYTGTDQQMYEIASALIQNRPANIEGCLGLPG